MGGTLAPTEKASRVSRGFDLVGIRTEDVQDHKGCVSTVVQGSEHLL